MFVSSSERAILSMIPGTGLTTTIQITSCHTPGTDRLNALYNASVSVSQMELEEERSQPESPQTVRRNYDDRGSTYSELCCEAPWYVRLLEQHVARQSGNLAKIRKKTQQITTSNTRNMP